MLTDLQKKTLLRLARQTIEEELGQRATDPVTEEELDDPELRQHRGVFVTLNLEGMLRGCIGSLLGLEPLIAGVRRHAVNAALRDNRFPLLTVDELAEVVIEISVLTPPQNLEYTDSIDLVSRLRPGIDGVILKIPGGAGATFLPQVWEQLPDPETFLRHLSLKAGLPADNWQYGDLTVQTYQAYHFDEQLL
ncbi:MAG: AmmeMemoRadiSam system protein A [Candidatus Electrothrix sp. GW3-4]|uniref:AmmeMemoRadiSam system protein A n=1 Tax=Candidatus Electrothrix sp. GW3-4 TaxID=3126740 RepID=UPI0030CB8751